MTQALSAKNRHPRRRYLGLFLPFLSAERALRTGNAPHDHPFVLIEKQRGAMRIMAVDRHAQALGLEPGLSLADARAQVPDLAAISHEPDADAALLDRLAHFALRYTPSVMVDLPQGLMLDVTGCAHLLKNGTGGIAADFCERLKARGLSGRTAIAGSPDAACALARFGGDNVRALPIAALATEPEVQIALRRAGFRSIGDLADLPSAPLAARFGRDFPYLLSRLLGEEDRHIVPRTVRDRVTAEMRFPEPIARTADVLDAIETLVSAAAEALRERGEGGRAFAVRLYRSDGHVAHLCIETGAPTRDPALVMRLLCERIDGLADPLDPGFGYDCIDLTVVKAESLAARQPELDQQGRQGHSINPLLDRLAVRYGPQSVMQFVSGDSHIPECAAALHPASFTISSPAWHETEQGEPPRRPLTLFDPPQRIDVLAAVPDGPPRRFRWRGKNYHVVRQEGPERIAAEWWRRRGGYAENPGLTRDYYRLEEEAGHRFWVFRHGLYGEERVDPVWYLHGLFA